MPAIVLAISAFLTAILFWQDCDWHLVPCHACCCCCRSLLAIRLRSAAKAADSACNSEACELINTRSSGCYCCCCHSYCLGYCFYGDGCCCSHSSCCSCLLRLQLLLLQLLLLLFLPPTATIIAAIVTMANATAAATDFWAFRNVHNLHIPASST